jgi:hypothetical protein
VMGARSENAARLAAGILIAAAIAVGIAGLRR